VLIHKVGVTNGMTQTYLKTSPVTRSTAELGARDLNVSATQRARSEPEAGELPDMSRTARVCSQAWATGYCAGTTCTSTPAGGLVEKVLAVIGGLLPDSLTGDDGDEVVGHGLW
jgi:hypothetical protein